MIHKEPPKGFDPKIEVVNVQELLEGKKMNLPTSVQVLKSAERKTNLGESRSIFDELNQE